MLKLSTLSLTLPLNGFKSNAKFQNKPTLINNNHMRNLSLSFNSNINDNYLDFTNLLVKNKSLGSLQINLNGFEFVSDNNLCKTFPYAQKLYKLSLQNIKFSQKNSYI